MGFGGRVIGVYMTPAMLAKARHNAAKAGIKNVEFRLGEIEHLPIADASKPIPGDVPNNASSPMRLSSFARTKRLW